MTWRSRRSFGPKVNVPVRRNTNRPRSFAGTGHDDVLKVINLPIVSNKQCSEMHKGSIYITSNRICAGGKMNEGVCEVSCDFRV